MNRLAVIGLDETAEELYRSVLRHPDQAVPAHAQELAVGAESLEGAAELLLGRRLVRIGADGGLVADHPRATLERLVSAEEARLAARRREVATLREAIDVFVADHHAGQDDGDAQCATREYHDSADVPAVLEHLAASTTGVIRLAHPEPPWYTPADHPVLQSCLEEGREVRAIYEVDSVQTRSLEVAQWAQAGEEQRLASDVPSDFACFGTDALLAAVEWGGLSGRYVVLRDKPVVEAFVELFDTIWATAMTNDTARDASSDRLVELLEAGFKDEAIARSLGVSMRTVRRRIAALMAECGVETRFQLAVALTERGVVGSAPGADGAGRSSRDRGHERPVWTG